MAVELYCVTNSKNGKCYVGITTRSADARWRGHIATAKHGPFWKFQKAIRKYGSQAFVVERLFTYASLDEARAAEIELIFQLDLVRKGYNSSPGGGLNKGDRRPKSAAHRAKIAAALRGHKKSAASVEKMRSTKKLNGTSEAQRAALIVLHDSNMGKTRSSATRQKMSEAAFRRWADERSAA